MAQSIVRRSLATEVLQVLRDDIQQGHCDKFLLPERQLGKELGISRPTLRTALRQLEKEGLIRTTARQGRQMAAPPALPAGRGRKIVRMLQNNLPTSFLNEHLQTQEFLAEHLRSAIDEFHIETAPGCFSSRPNRALELLVNSRPADLWILYRASEAMQRWFQHRNLDCIVMGSNYEGVDFVSIDQDYRAACRHAAGILVGRGHRRLAILIPSAKLPGDEASCAGFLEGLKISPHSDIEHCIATHNGTVPGICKTLKRLLTRPRPPTAWLIMNPQTYLTVITYLGTRNITVGGDVSLICRNSDPYFDAMTPGVAHYKRDAARMNKVLLNNVMQQVRGGIPQKKRWLIPSKFCDGASAGAAPSGRSCRI